MTQALIHLRTRLASVSPPFTDTFVFCPGWIDEPGEAKALAARFFGALQQALAPLGDPVTPLRIAVHWPSRPETAHGRTELAEWEIPLAPEASPPSGEPVMAILLSLDWCHGLAEPRLTADPTEGVSLVLGHGPDELVLRLSWDSLDALTLACLALDRPHGDD